jgi:peptidoglycan hydrolase-like protein with peptidoglycan-binding domain
MARIKLFSNFVNENYGDPTFMKLGDRGPAVQALQSALDALGFPLPKYGIDSKFGPETFGVSQATINAVAQLTNLAEIVNDPDVTKFHPDGLTKTQYNILNIIGHNPAMIQQIRSHLGKQTSAPTSGQTHGNEKAAYDFFISRGYTPAGAAAVTANLKTESGYKTTAVGDGGKARSLAQWHPDRFKDLSNKGFNLMDFDSALAAIDYELQHNYPRTYAKIKGAQDPAKAAADFDREYERSAGLSTQTRMRDAQTIFQKYNA